MCAVCLPILPSMLYAALLVLLPHSGIACESQDKRQRCHDAAVGGRRLCKPETLPHGIIG